MEDWQKMRDDTNRLAGDVIDGMGKEWWDANQRSGAILGAFVRLTVLVARFGSIRRDQVQELVGLAWGVAEIEDHILGEIREEVASDQN